MKAHKNSRFLCRVFVNSAFDVGQRFGELSATREFLHMSICQKNAGPARCIDAASYTPRNSGNPFTKEAGGKCLPTMIGNGCHITLYDDALTPTWDLGCWTVTIFRDVGWALNCVILHYLWDDACRMGPLLLS